MEGTDDLLMDFLYLSLNILCDSSMKIPDRMERGANRLEEDILRERHRYED